MYFQKLGRIYYRNITFFCYFYVQIHDIDITTNKNNIIGLFIFKKIIFLLQRNNFHHQIKSAE